MIDGRSAGIELGRGPAVEPRFPSWPELQVLGLRQHVFTLLEEEQGKPVRLKAGEEHMSATVTRDGQRGEVRAGARRVRVEPDGLVGEDEGLAPGELVTFVRVWGRGSSPDAYRDTTFRESGKLLLVDRHINASREQIITSTRTTLLELRQQRRTDEKHKAAKRQAKHDAVKRPLQRIFPMLAS